MDRARSGLALTTRERSALSKLVENPIYDLVPIDGMQQAAAALPPRASVSVTASPRRGVEATLDAAEWLAARGHDVCPHLAARSIRDRGHLADVTARLRAADIRKVFVVGGDGEAVGEFREGLSLLQALTHADDWFREIGVPSYPEGHPAIPDLALLDDLRAKQHHAQATTTQMSFNPEAVASWITRIRSHGIVLPIHLGVSGVLQLRKLMKIGARIGVADSTRYLMKHRGLLGQVMTGGSFGPDALLRALAPSLADPVANVRALHLFTMNQVADTTAWQRHMMDELSP
jgi:methylenetetrahydrofolate reductase (NADPH)